MTSNNTDIESVRQYGDTQTNSNNGGQIKKVFIENPGNPGGLSEGITDGIKILGDGTGGEVSITVNDSGVISDVTVTNGGQGYTYGIIDFGDGNSNSKLIPIIPPSRGHGYNIYEELGADKVLLYARFDDSTKDFPTDTKFSQVGIIKNPEKFDSTDIFKESTYSSLFSIALTSDKTSSAQIGTIITQDQGTGGIGTAKGYVASFDKETNILKYYQDRSLYFGNNFDQTDNNSKSDVVKFSGISSEISFSDGTPGEIDTTINGTIKIVGDKKIELGSSFTDGLSNPDINKSTGTIIYIDNRALVTRDLRQKEDVKIILEF